MVVETSGILLVLRHVLNNVKTLYNCLGISGNAQAIAEILIQKTSHNFVRIRLRGQGVELTIRENLGLGSVVSGIKVRLRKVSLIQFKSTPNQLNAVSRNLNTVNFLFSANAQAIEETQGISGNAQYPQFPATNTSPVILQRII